MRKKMIVLFSVLTIVIMPNYFTEGGCAFDNWEEVNASYTLVGGMPVLVCPSDGMQSCCVKKTESKEPKSLN
jgi:hypothetical protein